MCGHNFLPTNKLFSTVWGDCFQNINLQGTQHLLFWSTEVTQSVIDVKINRSKKRRASFFTYLEMLNV